MSLKYRTQSLNVLTYGFLIQCRENCQYASMIMKRCEVIARLNQPKSTGCPVKELPIDICGKSVQVNCDAVANFRTIDGSCNNLKNPEWGKAGSMQSRSVTNAYDDGMF